MRKERNREKNREKSERKKNKKREKKREKERKRCPGSIIINLHSIHKKYIGRNA